MTQRRRAGRYPQELRERAVRMVIEHRDAYDSEWEAMRSIAEKLGIGTTETLRKWVRQAEVDGGRRDGVTTAEAQRILSRSVRFGSCAARTRFCARRRRISRRRSSTAHER